MEKDLFPELINKDFKQAIPSADFTKIAMQKVEHAANNRKEVKPLISKKAWRIIGSCYAILFVLPILSKSSITDMLIIWQIDSIPISTESLKEGLQLAFNILFVLAALTLTDMLAKKETNGLQQLNVQQQ